MGSDIPVERKVYKLKSGLKDLRIECTPRDLVAMDPKSGMVCQNMTYCKSRFIIVTIFRFGEMSLTFGQMKIGI